MLAPHHSEHRSPPRGGYTLWELLLVLSLLVIITAISFPPIRRAYASYLLKQAAAIVSEQITAARLHAVDQGIPYQFQYESDGRFFVVLPVENSDADRNDRNDPKLTPKPIVDQLPLKFRFESTGDSDTVRQLAADELSEFDDARDLSLRSWSAPLQIDPDGTAEDWSVDIVGSQATIRVAVRGLTGGVSTRTIAQ